MRGKKNELSPWKEKERDGRKKKKKLSRKSRERSRLESTMIEERGITTE